MALINSFDKTKLRSLKYGGDRPGGGNSNQPYIESKIPKPDQYPAPKVKLVEAVERSFEDIKRLGKWFSQPLLNGILFTAKQNLLSRTAVPAQGGTSQAPKLLNEGVYTPLSTLAQAGVVAFGGHLNKQGLNPFDGVGLPYTPNLYLDKVKESNGGVGDKNRLYNLWATLIDTKTLLNPEILSYNGGPGSILGVGKTNIRFADQRTGKNNAKNINGKNTWTPNQSEQNNTDRSRKFLDILLSKATGVTEKYYQSTNKSINFLTLDPKPTDGNFVYQSGSFASKPNSSPQNTHTFNQTQIISQSAQSKTSFGSPSLQDFRTDLLKQDREGYIMSAAPDYATKNIDSSNYISMDSAGKRGNKKSYTKGKNNDIKNVIDKITSLGVQQGQYQPDLCSFRIDFLNTGRDNKGFVTKFIQFRAYLDNISDSYDPNWNSFKYPGRADSFYTYEGFDRKLTLGWSIVALSKGELEPMYEKLNYLASATTAEYSQYGYMKGVLTQLTIGNYIKELPGFINSLTYDISTDTTWEIGINDAGGFGGKQLPHVIKVAMGYTPIPNQLARFEVDPTSTPRFVNM